MIVIPIIVWCTDYLEYRPMVRKVKEDYEKWKTLRWYKIHLYTSSSNVKLEDDKEFND